MAVPDAGGESSGSLDRERCGSCLTASYNVARPAGWIDDQGRGGVGLVNRIEVISGTGSAEGLGTTEVAPTVALYSALQILQVCAVGIFIPGSRPRPK